MRSNYTIGMSINNAATRFVKTDGWVLLWNIWALRIGALRGKSSIELILHLLVARVYHIDTRTSNHAYSRHHVLGWTTSDLNRLPVFKCLMRAPLLHLLYNLTLVLLGWAELVLILIELLLSYLLWLGERRGRTALDLLQGPSQFYWLR